MTKSSNHTTEPLAWQSDRLLFDDLSPAEITDLEQQLADDQIAREALADEVLLLETIATLDASDFIVPTEPIDLPQYESRDWQRYAIWLASGVLAACLLIAASTNLQSNGTEDLANSGHDDLDQLADLWSENQALFVSTDLSEIGSNLPLDEAMDNELAPDWMFAALEASEEGMPEDEQWQ